MSIQHLPINTSPNKIHAVLEEDGCVVLDHALDAGSIDAILDEMKPHLDAAPMGDDEFNGFNTRRTGGLIGRSPGSHAVIMHPSILGVTDLALAHATNYQLHTTQVIEIGPDSEPQMIHRDQWAFDFFKFPPGFDSTFATRTRSLRR